MRCFVRGREIGGERREEGEGRGGRPERTRGRGAGPRRVDRSMREGEGEGDCQMGSENHPGVLQGDPTDFVPDMRLKD